MPPHRDMLERFWEKVNKQGPMPPLRPDLGLCWIWLGCKRPLGYGQFNMGRDHAYRLEYPHIISYELVNGPVPKGLELDHLCRIPPCLNPSHLEPVTHAENLRRGWWALHKPKTHCNYGHLYDAANTYINSKGYKECRICRIIKGYHRRMAA